MKKTCKLDPESETTFVITGRSGAVSEPVQAAAAGLAVITAAPMLTNNGAIRERIEYINLF